MEAIALKFLKTILNLVKDLDSNLRVRLSQAKLPLLGLFVAIALISLGACSSNSSEISSAPKANLSAVKLPESAKITISEVSPPAPIQELSRYFDAFEPQIKIIEPKSDQILTDTKVSVKLEVKDLPIFKNPELGLGTHVHIILDNREYIASYDLSKPLVFENLMAGTHTIRAFASRPWHESFKNEGAFAQTTFHVYTKTTENTPNPQLPLLTYSRPVGTYGAEPIMLDFYLRNTPLHAALLESAPTSDWQIRVTVNNQSFIVDQWLPVYIKGLNTGLNWVKLEFLDAQGHLVPNQSNSTAHLINYQPGGKDTLSRLVRGEAILGIKAIVNPNYIPESETPNTSASELKELKPELKPSPKTEIKPEKVKEPAPKPQTFEEAKIQLDSPNPIPLKPEIPPETPIAKEARAQDSLKLTTPKATNPIIKLPIAEPSAKEDFKPVEQVNQPVTTIPDPLTPKSSEVIVLPKQEIPERSELSTQVPTLEQPSESSAKVFKGLDNLNLGERLKQARQKKATESAIESSNE